MSILIEDLEGAHYRLSIDSCFVASQDTAVHVLAESPAEWRAVLELVCDLAERDGVNVLPRIDHGKKLSAVIIRT